MSQQPFGHDIDSLRVSDASTSRVQSAQQSTFAANPTSQQVQEAQIEGPLSGTLPNYVYQQLKQRRSEQDIRNELVDRGYTPNYAENLTAGVKRVYPAVRSQERQTQAAEQRAKRREEKSSWLATIIAGIGIFLLGVVVTFVGYAIAGPGGTYLFAGGAFLVGIFLVLKGLYHRLRWW